MSINELQKIREILDEGRKQLDDLIKLSKQGRYFVPVPEYVIDIQTETLDKIQEIVDEEGLNDK